MTAIYLAVASLVLLLLWVVMTYNLFVHARNKIDESFSGVDVQLARRHDLVPNLVSTVKAYAEHERSTLERVTQARSSAVAASELPEVGTAESELSGAISGVFAVAEQYPELKADQSFLRLQKDLTEVENEIAASRRIFNSNVQYFNTRVQSIPSSFVAKVFSIEARPFFELELTSDRAVPKLDLA